MTGENYSGWRSMDSAPRDGSEIIVAFAGDDESFAARWHDGSRNHWGNAGWYFNDDDLLTSRPVQPVAWQPFPRYTTPDPTP